MARYTESKCKLCRRSGEKLFLKGKRCQTEKCALVRRQVSPGQHGGKRRRLSDYGVQLKEKQKVKRIYGLFERQFRRYVEEAKEKRGRAGEVLLSFLERRLDNVVYRLGFAASRAQARQFVSQGKVKVNKRRVTTASFRVDKGDQLVFSGGGASSETVVPDWLKLEDSKEEAAVVRLPRREDIGEGIDEHLLLEFYSR